MSTVVTDRLREALGRNPKPLIICGAGVSVQASGGAAPNWKEMIAAGIARAGEIDANLGAWAVYARHRLDNEGAESWIQVADELTIRLGDQHNAEFLEFLEEQIGRLELRDSRLIEALLRLECPLATTNYDDLLFRASGFPVVNWTDAEEVARCLSGQWPGIIHLHGYWRKPESVVLGTRSYDKLVSNERNRLIGQLAALTRPTVFVGCSFDGISDPDFANLDRFIGQWQGATQPRYILVKAGGDSTPQLDRRLYPVIFGDTHDDLIPFVEDLTSSSPARATRSQVPAATMADVQCIDRKVPKPELFGRDPALADVASAVANGRSVVIAGSPGIGKTALAVATLYSDAVKSRYKENRVFVSLDEATEPRALVARLADELGLPAAGDEVSLLRSLEMYAGPEPVIAILDNAELVFEAQRAEAERILRLASQIAGLTVILTIRGVAPALPGALIIDDLAQLGSAAAAETFLASAGANFADDPDLTRLLDALDGHALSIQLVAAQASGIPRLKPLLDAWEDQHAAMVNRGDGDETRSSSLRASLALSIDSQRLKDVPLAKKLLSVLAYLPAGLSTTDVPKLLGKLGEVSRAKAAEATAVLHKLRLVERRLDERLRMLNPLREATRLLVPIRPQERKLLISRFIKVALTCNHISTPMWSAVKETVEREKDNLDIICAEAARTNIRDTRTQDALWIYAEFAKFTGTSGISSIEIGKEQAQSLGEWSCAATLSMVLGNIYFARLNFKTAYNYYKEGNNISSARGFHNTSANCLLGLGKVNLANTIHDEAERHYRDGLSKPLDGSSLVKANLLLRLAEIRIRQGKLGEAAEITEEVLLLYESGSLGEANVLALMARYKPAEAVDLLKQAIDICEKVGVKGSQAMYLNQLGTLTMADRDYATAIRHFSQALHFGKAVGEASAQAEALLRRGRATICLGDPAGQREVEEGMDLYLRVSSPQDRARPGWLMLRDALLRSDAGDANAIRAATAAEWIKVERHDLIANFVNDLFPESPRLP